MDTQTATKGGYSPEWYQKNREEILAKNKAWRDANPEKVAARFRNWIARNEGHLYTDKATGYVVYVGFDHPAAATCGMTRQHRIVLWDKLKGQDANCNWCGRMVYWSKSWPADADALVTDHVNGVRNDNRPENLVPSCQPCNSRRADRSGRPSVEWGACQATWADGSCEREASVHSNGVQVCSAHYQQAYAGKEFGPILVKVFSANTDGRKCNGPCGEYKTWDHYYSRNRGSYFSKCKVCCIEAKNARKAASAVAA